MHEELPAENVLNYENVLKRRIAGPVVAAYRRLGGVVYEIGRPPIVDFDGRDLPVVAGTLLEDLSNGLFADESVHFLAIYR